MGLACSLRQTAVMVFPCIKQSNRLLEFPQVSIICDPKDWEELKDGNAHAKL